METLAQVDPDFQLDPTAQLFKALAELARLRILNLLVHGGEPAIAKWRRLQDIETPKFLGIFSFLSTQD